VRKKQVAVAAVTLSLCGLYLWHSKDEAKGAPPPAAPKVTVSPPVAPDPKVASAEVTPPQPPQVIPQAQPSQGQGNDTPSQNAPPARPKVDIVFAIDTTSSMGGLIAGAKARVWEIARMAQQGKPAPQLRVGLVAYRDRGDAYVTRVMDLTSDMDAVYARLTELRAEGGGNSPEHVLKGLHDAVDAVHWSDDPGAVKLAYLVGDAPPHTDYQDGITLDGVVRDATHRGIRISAIRCGNDPQTLVAWTEIARRTDGEVSTIAQGGGVASVTTPYDTELARLNAALARTEIHYGSADERRAAGDALSRGLMAPAPAQAARASFYGTAAAAHAAPMKKDLAAAPSPSALGSVAVADLPEDMQAMTGDERAKFVAAKQAERASILAQVAAEGAKRDQYLKAAAPATDTSFDAKVYDSLKKAGAKKGISF
jgi:Mg-chelatase subunit ChlD